MESALSSTQCIPRGV
ncbi:hypothetical protein SNEBB_001224, partial [Seison nebaliae]